MISIMLKQEKINAFIEKALVEMFERVNAEYTKEFVARLDWYQKYSWTQEEEDAYRDWFLKEIKKDLKLTKKEGLKEFQWFCLDYGWKLKESQESSKDNKK